jgi:hypothetical protein
MATANVEGKLNEKCVLDVDTNDSGHYLDQDAEAAEEEVMMQRALRK